MKKRQFTIENENPLFLSLDIVMANGNRVELSYQNRKQNNDISYRIKVDATDPLGRWTSRPEDYISSEALKYARLSLAKLERKQKRIVSLGRRMPAYKVLAAEAKRLGLPTHYKEDLTFHDAYAIGAHNPAAFLWAIRECGTHMILYDDTTPKALKWAHEWISAIIHQKTRGEIYYLYTDKRGLKQCNPEYWSMQTLKDALA